jgi:hypothetical protein
MSGMRQARVFDGAGEDGRPYVSPRPVPAGEAERVLAYLEKAPLVLAARGFDTDAVDASRGAAVPMTFHTDGEWIWPGAVAYYLRTHEIPPEPDLLAHIRARGFAPREVDDHTRDVAASIITGAPEPEGRTARPSPAEEQQRELAAQADRAREQAALTRLSRRLAELGVDPAVYRVDDVADDTWCLVRADGGWSVFWSERGGRHNLVSFAAADQAAAYLLGMLLIVPSRMRRSDRSAGHGASPPDGRCDSPADRQPGGPCA